MDMSQDEIVDAIEDENIAAISIDTNVFEKAHYGFESGVLSRVRQFAESSTDFVMSDIIIEEVLAHLRVSAADSRRVYEKATKELSKGWALSPKRRDELSMAAFGDKTADQVANERLTKYLQDTSALTVKASDTVKVGDLVGMYFQHQPPFAKNDSKKHEFPDAMALLSLESWAEAQCTLMLVVSEDPDWSAYCRNSKSLVCVSDLAVALGLFQKDVTRYCCERLDELIKQGDQGIFDAINKKLNEESDSIDVDAEGGSQFRCELEMAHAIVSPIEPGNVISNLDPIEFDSGVLVARLTVSVPIEVIAHFSFEKWDGIDREYMPMGSGSASKEDEVECDVIITFRGKLPERPEIADVEVSFKDVYAEFDDVEPDWMSDPDNFGD